MKKFGKLISLVCVGTMLFSSITAFAAENSSTGSGALENATTTDVSFDSVILPTMPAGTYNFTLDPQKLLSQYDPAQYPDAGTFYFKSVTTKATIANKEAAAPSATDGKLYVKELVAGTDLTALKAAITVADSAITDVAAGFSLWVPDSSKLTTGDGKELAIDTTNINNYFDIVLAETSVTSIEWKEVLNADASVCDEKIYAYAYTEITDPATFDVTGHVSVSAQGAVTFVDIYTKANDAETYTLATTDTVKYTAPVSTYNAKSDVLTIGSKSTKAKTVTATITVENGSGLTFTNDNTFADDTAASVCLSAVPVPGAGLGDTVYVGGDAQTATLTFEIAPAVFTPITYRGEVDPLTGGHLYHKYAPYEIASSSVSFYLEGASNGTEDAKEAWDAYAEYLRTEDGATRPGVKVVYKIEDKILNAGPSIENTTYSKATGGALTIPYSLGTGELAATAITDVAIEFNDTFYSKNGAWDYDSSFAEQFTINADSIQISSTWMGYCTAGSTYKLRVVYDNNISSYDEITITVTE